MSETEASPCALCEPDRAKPAVARCAACDSPVCPEHHRAMFNLCKGCATDERLERVREGDERPHPREQLGIKWVDE